MNISIMRRRSLAKSKRAKKMLEKRKNKAWKNKNKYYINRSSEKNDMLRGGAVVARQAHNLKAVG